MDTHLHQSQSQSLLSLSDDSFSHTSPQSHFLSLLIIIKYLYNILFSTISCSSRWRRAETTGSGQRWQMKRWLLSWNHSHASSSSPVKSTTPSTFLRWGIRQPRSRSTPISIRCHGGVSAKRNGSDTTTRFSPTTPLSWSGGAGSSSPIGTTTADGGFEESSRPPAAFRSKGTITTNEITSDAKNKMLRRKKTFAELKEEESSLLKERMQLTEKIATRLETVKEQSVRNGSLKRLKHDLALHPVKDFSLTSEWKPKSTQQHKKKQDYLKKQEFMLSGDSGFVLPDLNMMPSEDDCRTDTLNGD